jgi:hypothetical protein
LPTLNESDGAEPDNINLKRNYTVDIERRERGELCCSGILSMNTLCIRDGGSFHFHDARFI